MWLEGNTTAKPVDVWKQPKNQKAWETEPLSLETLLMIFKSTLIQEDNPKSFPRYATKLSTFPL